MSSLSPAEQLMAHARSLLRPGDTLAFATDTTSYAGRHVLLALVRPGGVDVVLSIRATEWDGMKALPILQFETERVPALERARRAIEHASDHPAIPKTRTNTSPKTRTRRTT